MASTPIYRFTGQAMAIACVGTAVSGPVTVTGNAPTCAFWNFTNTAVAVTTTVLNATGAPTGFAFPVSGTPSGVPCVILPPLMDIPITVVVPPSGFNVFAVAQATGNPSVQFSPAEMQS